jgi:hypothetical protein
MNKANGLLSSYELIDTQSDSSLLMEKYNKNWDKLDEYVLSYLEHRIKDVSLRDRVKKILKQQPLPRGPKSKDGMSPRVFHDIIQVEKKVFGHKTIKDTIFSFCKLRGYPDYDFDFWLEKYSQGGKSKRKQGGN